MSRIALAAMFAACTAACAAPSMSYVAAAREREDKPPRFFPPPLAIATAEDAVVRVVGRHVTCSGTLVEDDLGRGLAPQVARDLVVYLKGPGGQSQFSMHLHSQNTSHPGIRATQEWLMSNLSLPLDVSVLAGRAAMSERNFRRVFA